MDDQLVKIKCETRHLHGFKLYPHNTLVDYKEKSNNFT